MPTNNCQCDDPNGQGKVRWTDRIVRLLLDNFQSSLLTKILYFDFEAQLSKLLTAPERGPEEVLKTAQQKHRLKMLSNEEQRRGIRFLVTCSATHWTRERFYIHSFRESLDRTLFIAKCLQITTHATTQMSRRIPRDESNRTSSA